MSIDPYLKDLQERYETRPTKALYNKIMEYMKQQKGRASLKINKSKATA